METIRCPLCHETASDLIFHGSDTSFDNPGKFSLVQCRNCGMVYLKNRPSPEEIKRFYPKEYIPFRRAIQDERFILMRWARKRNIRKRIRVVEQFSPMVPGRILDIGCSTGIFLDSMQKAGWKTKGVEPNITAAKFAQERFHLEVFPGLLKEAEFSSKAFEAITLWDVLEHTFDPIETLNEVNRLLNNNGIMALTIPNWESLDRKIFGQAWIGYDIPRHLFLFPRDVLVKIIENAGFRLEQIWCGLSGYYTFIASVRRWGKGYTRTPGIANFMLHILEFPGARFPIQPLFTLIDKFHIGGTLVVVARKA